MRTVALMADATTVIGYGTLASDFPATPAVIKAGTAYYVAGPSGGGGAGGANFVPGRPDISEGYVFVEPEEVGDVVQVKPRQ